MSSTRTTRTRRSPSSAADRADELVDHIAPPVGSAAEDATVETDAEAEGPTAEQEAPIEEPDAEEPGAEDEDGGELAAIAEGAVLAERSSRGPIVPLLVIGVLIAAVIGVVIAVGGGDDDLPASDAQVTTTTAAAAPGTEVPPSPDLLPMPAAEALEYFQAYGTQDPTQLERMVALAAPDTPAGYYAVHQETLARIDPQRNAPLDVEQHGEEIEACPQDLATGGCVVYADFTKNGDGRLTHFSINGTPLRDRVAIGGTNEVKANGMRISVISRYVSVSDRLFIAYVVNNDGTTPITPGSVRYTTPSGDTVEPDNDTFRDPVAPGSSTVAAAAFPTTEAGGTLVVSSTADSGQSQQVAQISTP